MDATRLNRVVRSVLYLLRINKINDAQQRTILLEALENIPKAYCGSCIFYEKCKGKNKKLRKNTVACAKYTKDKKPTYKNKKICGNCSLFDECKKEKPKIRKNSAACNKFNKIEKIEVLSEKTQKVIEHINQITNHSELFETDPEKCILGTNIQKPNMEYEKIKGKGFVIVGAVRRTLRSLECPLHIIQKYSDSVNDADYEELIKISKKYVNFV